MTRGAFNFLRDEKFYKKIDKVWYVNVIRSDCFWFDLIANKSDTYELQEPIKTYLRSLKQHVEETLEKRFIYFFASRPKVRVDIKRKPRYSRFSGALIITLLVGGCRRRVKAKVRFCNENGDVVKPEVWADEKFIRIFNASGGSTTYPIHDFIRVFKIELGFNTQIHYVGLTKNPESRPTNRQHRGITDTLLNVSTGDNDFFLFVNLFKVTCFAHDHDYGMSFAISNAMIDEVSVNLEGAIIERSLVTYFNSPIQKNEDSHERSGLVAALKRIKSERNIVSITVDLEMEIPDEYFTFFSPSILPAERHIFSFKLKDSNLSMQHLPRDFNASKEFLHR